MNHRQPLQQLRTSLAVLGIFIGSGCCVLNSMADEAADYSRDVMSISRQKLAEMEDELDYLRKRDAQYREWQEQSIENYLNTGTSLLTQCSYDVAFAGGSAENAAGRVDEVSYCCNCPRCGKCCSCACPTQPAPCIDCPHVSTLSPYFNISVFGSITMDMLFSERRPVAPGTPYFLGSGPVGGRDQNTVDLHARQSTVGAALSGPEVGGWQTGGQVLGIFYNDNVIADKYGFLPMQAYGELRNDAWRFAAGLQFDVFNPMLPTILPFSALSASGNSGNAFRGQVRVERFLPMSEYSQWTLQAALSEPIATTISPTFAINEDNGWPNVELRAALGLGEMQGAGIAAQRPFEWGWSGVVGQIRTSPVPPDPQVVANVWGVGSDLRWRMTQIFGMAAEVYSGQGLGTYNGAILQTVNIDTFQTVRSTGGWCEAYVYLTSNVHSHWGYGIDDPLDRDISVDPTSLGRIRNETYFGNLLWDVNPTMRVGFEYTWRDTTYAVLPDNAGSGFHMQCRWVF